MSAPLDIKATTPFEDPSSSMAPHERADIFRPGEVLADAYQIVKVIGSGGMGQVFEAHDLGLDRRVALKAAWPTSPPGRLREEARALAAVRHSSSVAVFALGRHRDIEFMAMERLYGVGLDDHIDQRRRANERFGIDEVLDVLHGLTEALYAIHRAGLAHQDIKPENVMIAPGGRIVVLDLGIGIPEVNVGAEKRFEGSPAYMAPEAITLATKPGGAHLLDLYALGILAFELLTGDVPFDGKTVWEILGRHVNEAMPDVRTVRSDVPRALAELIADLTAKEPSSRPQSAETVLWHLDSLRKRESVRPTPGSLDVLIVDDEPGMREGLAMLVREGAPHATIRTARDGEIALALVRERMPDVIVTDLDMPRMNGIEILMHLRGMRTAALTKVVAVSGTADVHDRSLLQSLGVNRFIPKDIDQLERLADVIRELDDAR